MRRLRNRFLTPGGTPRRRTVVLATAIGAFIIVLLALPPAWEYSNSPDFCGTTCHTMPPEFNTYLVSPHARVLCVDCHIGRGLIIQQFVRKAGHMRLLWATLTNSYEYPIYVSTMRPARETCELCHYPQKFSDDSLRMINRYRDDEQNTPYDVYLLMHTGGGSHREGLGRGIHWHVENVIEYIATDELEQDIPWIRVTTVEGEMIEYVAEDSTIDTANLDQYDIKVMDCITCHNRISHLLDQPRNMVDAALFRGDISTDVPFIRQRAIDLLVASALPHEEASAADAPEVIAAEGPTPEQVRASFASLETYYRDNYPAFYADNSALVADAVAVLERIYADNAYPQQLLDWNTHPDNIGHRDWPGCFRCHDGRHFSADGEAVRLECNLCHSIPQVVHPGDIEPMLPLATGIEPASHRDTTWISRHHNEFDRTCANCHTVNDPGGTSDTSFCSNSQCHGIDWRYGGFDAPTLAIELGLLAEEPPETVVAALPAGEAVTYAALQPVFEARCGGCHGSTPSKGLRVTDYESLMAGGSDGPVIVPGDPEASRIVQVLSGGHFAPFGDEEMTLLRQWIAAGAPPGETAPVGTTEATYQALQPALESRCGRCHGAGVATKGLRVTDYESLMAGGSDGPVIVPGDPEASLIVQVLAEGHFAQLSDEDVTLLRQWIAAGAPSGPAAGPSGVPPARPTPTEEGEEEGGDYNYFFGGQGEAEEEATPENPYNYFGGGQGTGDQGDD